MILEGPRDKTTKLWHLPTTFQTIVEGQDEDINNVYHLTTQAAQIQYLHASAGYPVPTTWIKAIKKGFYTTWPGISAKAVIKHLPKSVVTAKGHMTQTRQNIRSTRREHKVYAMLMDTADQIAMDLTGKFPVTSSRGHRYLLIVWDGDSNAIIAEPMKNRSDNEYIRAYQLVVQYLTERGCKPKLQKLDNEASKALKAEIRGNDISFQLAPPDMHRTNPAEKAVDTFKKHFIAILAGTDPNFPLHLWCRLVKPAQMTLNMMRASNVTPNISAYTQLEGIFDYNATPISPLGTKVVTHDKPSRRRSWAAHGTEGWYIGLAMEHYRCHIIYNTATRAERISDTVTFFPTHVHIPQVTTADKAIIAAEKLTAAIKEANKKPITSTLDDAQLDALNELANIFKQQTNKILPAIDIGPILEPIFETQPKPHAKEPRVVPKTPPNIQKPHHAKPRVVKAHDPPHQFIGRKSLRPRAPEIPIQFEHMAFAVFDDETGKLLEYKQLQAHPRYRKTWQRSFANELGRLAQGIRDVDGTSTIFFIPRSKVPHGRTVTYGRIVCEIRTQKKEVERTRLTVGGNLIDYPDNLRTETADLLTFKILVNSIISTPGAKFLCLDVKNFYLNTPMGRYEYMRLPMNLIPQEIIDKYNLDDIAEGGFVYCEIRKGMYGLPQAGKLANDLLKTRLAKHGYYPSKITPGLWHHETRPTKFTLIVDDFGAKVEGNHGQHLIDSLRQYYEVSVDETGSLYAGIAIDWDYPNKQVDLHMPKYVADTRHEIGHPNPKRPQHAPSKHNAPVFGSDSQKLQAKPEAPPATPGEIKKIQRVVGRLLYYGRGTDPTLLHALNDLAATTEDATEDTVQATEHLLDYVATHPNAKIRYTASPMILHIHSDASYLTAAKARSRAGGHFFLSTDATKNAPYNGPIHSLAKIIKNVMASAAESELGALFMNSQEGIPVRNTLTELGHKQPPTPLRIDNKTAQGIATMTCKPQKTKSMDMKFHWVKDREAQGHYNYYWAPGKINLGDYYTKHHPKIYHQIMRRFILNSAKHILTDTHLQGCAESLKVSRRTRDSRGTK